MNGQRYDLGLTGFPLGHSLSPVLQRAALAACGLNGSYELFPIEKDVRTESRLQALCDEVRNGSLTGFNVTIPYKQMILPFLDEVSENAKAIGAVNTVYWRGGRVCGENTDGEGFRRDLAHLIDPAVGQTVLVLGAGGAARSVVYTLTRLGWKVMLAARRIEQAEGLAQDLQPFTGKGRITAISLDTSSIDGVSSQCSLIINTTPVGMGAESSQSPWPAGTSFPVHTVLYDLIYNPEETVLMKKARMVGLTCRNGLGMLVEQAVMAFTIWTGIEIDSTVMRNALSAYQNEVSRRKE